MNKCAILFRNNNAKLSQIQSTSRFAIQSTSSNAEQSRIL